MREELHEDGRRKVRHERIREPHWADFSRIGKSCARKQLPLCLQPDFYWSLSWPYQNGVVCHPTSQWRLIASTLLESLYAAYCVLVLSPPTRLPLEQTFVGPFLDGYLTGQLHHQNFHLDSHHRNQISSRCPISTAFVLRFVVQFPPPLPALDLVTDPISKANLNLINELKPLDWTVVIGRSDYFIKDPEAPPATSIPLQTYKAFIVTTINGSKRVKLDSEPRKTPEDALRSMLELTCMIMGRYIKGGGLENGNQHRAGQQQGTLQHVTQRLW